MYSRNDIKKMVSKVFDENGIDIDDFVMVQEMDSLQYMSIIISLEELFEIEFPDSILMTNIFDEEDRLIDLINVLLENKCS